MPLDTKQAIKLASDHLLKLPGHVFDVITLAKPVTAEAAVNLAKVISKLSPMLGNMIEINVCEFLNTFKEFQAQGKWMRQDPGFPDTVFEGDIKPQPGFEIKAWFPLATEMTARFRDSQRALADDNSHVVILAWLPEKLIYGRPYILDAIVIPGLSLAKARDYHYHDPPDYLVIEPRDTSSRTRNLQQTNTAGYKFQGTEKEFEAAKKLVAKWGKNGCQYSTDAECGDRTAELLSKFTYRLDTNYAKIDRVAHPELEKFKAHVIRKNIFERSVLDWARLLGSENDEKIKAALEAQLDIKEEKAVSPVK